MKVKKKKANFNITEDVKDILSDAIVESEHRVIKNIKVMNSKSLNGRIYEDKAMRSVSKMVGKSFWNHQDGMFSNPVARDMKEDLLGRLTNGRFVKKEHCVYADLKVRKKHWADMEEIVEEFADECGFSIVAHGIYADEQDDDGNDVVKDIDFLFSTDLVALPATTKTMFEEVEVEEEEPVVKKIEHQIGFTEDDFQKWIDLGYEASPNLIKKGGDPMKEKILRLLENYLKPSQLKDMSEDSMVEYIRDQFTTQAEECITVKTENTTLKKSVVTLEDEKGVIEKERDILKVEAEAVTLKEKKEKELADKTEFVDTAILEAGLKADDVTAETHTILVKLDEEEVPKLLQIISDKLLGVKDSGREQSNPFEKEGKKVVFTKENLDDLVQKYAGHKRGGVQI